MPEEAVMVTASYKMGNAFRFSLVFFGCRPDIPFDLHS